MKYGIILFLLLCLCSCKSKPEKPEGGVSYFFENAQPVAASALNAFPRQYRGLYQNEDSIYLRITENTITKESVFKTRIHRFVLDTLKDSISYHNGVLRVLNTCEAYNVRPVGDSLELSQRNADTLFRLSETQRAKRCSDLIVLNTKDSVFWTIKTLRLQKNMLRLRYISLAQDVQKMDSITKTKARSLGTGSYLVRPGRAEFKKIVKIKGLGEEQPYYKTSA